MKIPKGPGWQVLREKSLRFLPPGVGAFYKTSLNLGSWRQQGFYTVASYSKSEAVINVSAVDITGVMLAEAEWLLDHAAEHRASLKRAAEVSWFSPAWLLVTAYYWSYFTAVCLTRLVGDTVWFLDDKALEAWKVLAPNGTGRIRAGTLRAEIVFDPSQQDLKLILKSSGKKPHEAAWIALHKIARELLAASNPKSNLDEYRLWCCICSTANALGEDWPSQVRNQINYRTAVGYREVVMDTQIKLKAYIENTNSLDLPDFLDKYESELALLQSAEAYQQDLNLLTKLVYLNAVGLARIAETLNKEITSRTTGDPRWANRRQIFLQGECGTEGGNFWPFVGGCL